MAYCRSDRTGRGFIDLKNAPEQSYQMLRRRLPTENSALRIVLATGLMLLLGWLAQPAFAQESETEKKAWALHSTAANAQNEKEFEFACKKWQALLDNYPNSKAARKAALNQGRCFYALKDYASAILAFKAALPIVQEDDPTVIPELLLGLGYSRIQEGRRLGESNPEESSSQFTTAALHLNTILLNHKDSGIANAAAYHRGQALEALGQMDEAKAAFQQSLDFEQDNLQVEAMYALGKLSLKAGEFEDAGRWYDRIRTVTKADGHRMLNDTNLNYGDALINMGLQRLRDNDIDGAHKKFLEAKALLGEVAQDETFDLRDNAIFLDASCSMYLGDDANAAELYEAVANLEGSELRDKALVLAGSSWLKAGDEARGSTLLQRAIDSKSTFAFDAVHEKALWLVGADRSKEAYELTTKWAPLAKDHPLAADIYFDRANAARNVPELADQTAELYAQIAKDFPSHPLAPKSLYYSAFSNYKRLNNYDAAIAQAEAFEKSYAGDEFLPDMREVRADSLLMQTKYSDAEAVFRDLANDFQSDKVNRSRWITRAGFASYLQENFDDTIQWLEGQDASITQPRYKAEALHWIGSSLFQKEQYADAIDKLQQSLDIDRTWDRTPEVMLALCKAQLKRSKFEDAEKTAATLLESFPENPDDNVGRALYAVGDELLSVKEFDRAIRNFDLLSNRFEKSELAPFAVFRAAIAARDSKNGEDAVKRFTNFLDKFPEHELAKDATLGRSNALRMTGNTTESIAALKTLVENADDDETRQTAKYQLGLAYADAKEWSNAVDTLSSMTGSLKADSPIADKVWYELAWAQRENGDADGSLESFASLVENHPNSSTAPEAHFLLGSKAYTDKKYDVAIDHYSQADTDVARDEIREKARYKLGWCHFRKGNFDAAGQQFKKQAEGFSDGKLYADGLYMIAQCAFRADNFQEAYQAYTVAKPAIEEYGLVDERVKKLTQPTLLNGARSGNETQNFKGAAEMATTLMAMPNIDASTKQKALLELGIAQTSMDDIDGATKSLTAASTNDGETGAHAKALLGDILFKEAVDAAKKGDTTLSKSKFSEAIDTYSEVYFRYDAALAPANIKSWQAYATYEAARCYMVQINDAADVDKVILIGKAIDRYQKLIDRFPGNDLIPEAEKQLKKLNAIKEKISQ